MLISEIYRSIQGEGMLTGTPSMFVRTSGCNLRCGFCDTPFASWTPEGERLSIPEIMARIDSVANTPFESALFGSTDAPQHIVITGGEPCLQRQIIELCRLVSAESYHITIETAGTIYRNLNCDLMSISPKLSNSDPDLSRAGEWQEKHQRERHRPDIVKALMQQYDYQLKFVVGHPDDLNEILNYLEQIEPFERSRVLLMPEGIDQQELESRAQWLIPMCHEHRFAFAPRRHIEWFGNRRGT